MVIKYPVRLCLTLFMVFSLGLLGCNESTTDPPPPGGGNFAASISSPSSDICINPGDAVSFDGTVVGGAEPYTYLWSFGDPAIADSEEIDPENVIFPNKGIFTVKFTATDADSLALSDQVIIRVKDDCAPFEAQILTPVHGGTYEPGVLLFEGSASGGQLPYQYQWLIDGIYTPWSDLPGTSSTFVTEGPKTTQLQVKDALGDVAYATSYFTIQSTSGGSFVGSPVGAPAGLAALSLNFAGASYSTQPTVAIGPEGHWAYDWKKKENIWITNAPFALPKGMAAVVSPTKKLGESDALFGYGGSGAWVSHWTGSSWGAQIEIESTSVVDGVPHNLDPGTGTIMYTMPNVVKELVFNVSEFETAPTTYPIEQFPGHTGDLVSAYASNAIAGFLALTDGSPGQLWFHPRSGDATLVTEVGNSPYEVRSTGSLIVVSNSGSSTLSLGRWGSPITINETATVGAGPRGVDIVRLNGSQKLVACAGYDDNTYTVLVVAATTGVVAEKVTRPLPAGATKPVDVIWVQVPERRLVVACEGSSNLVEIDTGF